VATKQGDGYWSGYGQGDVLLQVKPPWAALFECQFSSSQLGSSSVVAVVVVGGFCVGESEVEVDVDGGQKAVEANDERGVLSRADKV